MAPFATRMEWIPPGPWGSYVTLARMAELAHAGAGQSLTRHTVLAIMGGSQAPRDRWSRAMLLRQWMAEHFAFLHDPVGPGVFGVVEDIEQLTAPAAQLQAIQRSYVFQGDCDDAAILGATLALAAQLQARFHVVGFQAGGGFSHVWTDVLTERGWAELDVTRRSQVIPPIVVQDVYPV